MAVATEQETNYYAISYTPANRKYEGKFREIKVSLSGNQKKLHLIHRAAVELVQCASTCPCCSG